MANFNTFISYNSEDRATVRELADALVAREIRPWFDERDLVPGRPWQEALEEVIRTTETVVVAVGPTGLGPWEKVEMNACLHEFVERELPVIPVLLPGAPEHVELPLFLKKFVWVDLRGGFSNEGVDRLEWGITGVKSVPPASPRRKTSVVEARAPEGMHSIETSSPPPAWHLNESRENSGPSGEAQSTFGDEYQYDNLFVLSSLRLPYITIFGSYKEGANELRRGEVDFRMDSADFSLPEDFPRMAPPRENEEKCRLVGYECEMGGKSLPNRWKFTFSKVWYSDYLRSGELLEKIDPSSNTTYRSKYARRDRVLDFGSSRLTNICGVGLFVGTRDGHLIISRQSSNVSVSANAWGYSASGTMDWTSDVDPYKDAIREAAEEIAFNCSVEDLLLFGFGVDSKRLYVQFSFYTESAQSVDEILARAPLASDFAAEHSSVIAIPMVLDVVIEHIKKHEWEPAAAAGVLTLCAKRFGRDLVEHAIDPEFMRDRNISELTETWDIRSKRPGLHAVMSQRYPFEQCDAASADYITSVKGFIDRGINNRNVVEVGCGIGRFSGWLLENASKVTCVDVSSKMIERTRESLGQRSDRIDFVNSPVQMYYPSHLHDVAIVSLVLGHAVSDIGFHETVEAIKRCARVLYVLEHTDTDASVSTQTRNWSVDQLRTAFDGFQLTKQDEYLLFDDRISFLKFEAIE